MKTAEIKELIVEHVRQNPIPLVYAINPASEVGDEYLVKEWKRISKNKIERKFECWVGWNQLIATVKTNSDDSEIESLNVELRRI